MRTKNPYFSSLKRIQAVGTANILAIVKASEQGVWRLQKAPGASSLGRNGRRREEERGGRGGESCGEGIGGSRGVLPGTEAALNRAQFEPVSPGRTHWGFIAGSSEYVVSSAEGKYCCLVEFLREGSLVWESGAELPENEEGGSGSLLLCLLRQAVLDLLRGPSPGCGVPGATGPGPSVGGCPFQGSCAQAGWVWLRFLFSRRAVAF